MQRSISTWVILISLAVAAGLAIAAASLPAAAGSRLSPAFVPLMLSAILCISAGFAFRRRIPVSAEPAAGLRAITATIAAIIVLALATRPAGVFLATFAGAGIAAAGVAGVSWRRALLVGAVIAIGVGALLLVVGRQPLPIWPSGLPW